MKGFKEFLLAGNVVELAVAFIIATALAKVVEAFVKIIMDLISIIFKGPPNFDDVTIGSLTVGPFITAIISFIMVAAVVYFAVVRPYQNYKAKRGESTAPPEVQQIELLTEIRDSLRTR